MPPWDEQGAPAGTPGTTPNALTLAAIAAKLFGKPNPAAGMEQAPQSTAAVTPLAGGLIPGGGTPPPNMPPGVGGVPANNLPQGTGAPQSRPLPSPNSMLGGNFSFPNKQARNGAVVATGIENMAEAIHNFKVSKDQNDYTHAKNTWDLYQKAAALDPQTGQPVDPHTMAVLANDPKIVKSWEKYLKMDFPQQQAIPPSGPTAGASGKKGAPQATQGPQGPPMMPKPTADPAAMAKQLVAQRQLEQLRAAPGETGGLTPEESHTAALVEAGIKPKAQDQKALDKIDAEINNIKSEQTEHEAQAAKLTQELTTIPIENNLKYEQIKTQIEEQKKLAADAFKDYNEATKSKTLQEFTVGRTSIKDVLTQQSRSLSKMQSQAMAARSKLGKAFGSDPDVSPEQEAQQNRVTSLNDAYTSYVGMQDDVTAGRITPSDAMTKARRSAGLDSDLNMWGGVPVDAPQTPPKEWEDGHVLTKGGIDIAVKQGNKWVAP